MTFNLGQHATGGYFLFGLHEPGLTKIFANRVIFLRNFYLFPFPKLLFNPVFYNFTLNTFEDFPACTYFKQEQKCKITTAFVAKKRTTMLLRMRWSGRVGTEEDFCTCINTGDQCNHIVLSADTIMQFK